MPYVLLNEDGGLAIKATMVVHVYCGHIWIDFTRPEEVWRDILAHKAEAPVSVDWEQCKAEAEEIALTVTWGPESFHLDVDEVASLVVSDGEGRLFLERDHAAALVSIAHKMPDYGWA